MSLIDDALRRVQDPIANSELPPAKAPVSQKPQAPVTTPKKADPKPHSWNIESVRSISKEKAPVSRTKSPSLVLLTALLITGVCVIWIASLFMVKPATRAFIPVLVNKPADQPGQNQASPSGNSAAPQNPAEAKQRFKVTGVVVGKGAPYAVIDGRIVAKGESIEEATVVEITESSVTLQFPDKSQSVLRVPR